MTTRLNGVVQKGWGHELIWVSNEKYCSKFLHFKEGAKFSMHFHAQKEESWYVLSGEFLVRSINTTNASQKTIRITPGDVWHNKILEPHQLICEKEGMILEVSTPDSVEDNYRIEAGDSQDIR